MDDYSEKQFEVRKKLLLIFITLLAFLIFAYLAGDLPWITNILPFIELVSSIVSIFLGLLSLVRFYTKKKKLAFLVLGIGFLFIGFLDGVEIISSIQIFEDLFNYSDSEFFPLSMVLSKAFLAVMFFLSWLVNKDYDNLNSKQEKIIAISTVSIFLVLSCMIFIFSNVVSVSQEYIPAIVGGVLSLVMFVFTLFGYLRSPAWRYESFEYWQVFSLVFLLVSTVFFLPFLNLEYELALVFSVLAQALSYILLLVGFLISIYEIYSRETEYLNQLRKKNELLLKSKNSVEEAYMLLRKEKWQIARGKGKGSIEKILKNVIGEDNED